MSESLPKRERHSRTPDSVLLDERLSWQARVVYAVMARHAFKNGKVTSGQRWFAALLKVSQSTVSRRIRELARCGHVEIAEGKAGYRTTYRLVSNIFLPREKKVAGSPRKQISSTLRYARAFVENQAG